MNISQRISLLATEIGNKFKQLISNQGSLASLATTEKGSLVGAINEVKATAGVQINDNAASSTTTYSSTKIHAVADAAALATKNQLLNGASAAFDTLQEVEAGLNNNASAAANLTTAVANRVRYDAAQSLSALQMIQACSNIGIGDPDTDFSATFTTSLS